MPALPVASRFVVILAAVCSLAGIGALLAPMPLEGTVGRRLADLAADQPTSALSSWPRGFLDRGDHVLFVANEGVWSTDGKPSGTRRVLAQNVPQHGRESVYLWVDEDVVVLRTVDGRLWITDGAPASIRPLDLPVGEYLTWEIVRIGDRFWVSRGSELWSVSLDGAATRIVDLGGQASARELTPWNGGVVFTAEKDCEGTPRTGIWWTDGTEAGTTTLYCDPNDDAGNLAVSGSRLVFRAGPSLWSMDSSRIASMLFEYEEGTLVTRGLGGVVALVRHSPVRVQITDGTVAGTRTVIDLSDLDGGSWSSFIDPAPTTGGLAIMASRWDGSASFFFENGGASPPKSLRDLCGSACGELTIRAPGVLEDPFVLHDGAIFFVGEDPIHGVELWRTDGTVAGTGLVVDACPGACGWVTNFSAAEGGLAFRSVAEDGSATLWHTDGTIGNGEPISSVAPGHLHSVSTEWTLAAPDPARPGQWLFAGFDELHAEELWTGGGGSGRLLADLGEGFDHASPVVTIRPLNQGAWFASCHVGNPWKAYEYWTTSGLPATTVPYDIRTLACSPGYVENSIPVVSLGDRVLAQEAHGITVSDGISVENLVEGYFFLIPSTDVLDRAYLAVWGTNELWTTDGTPAGTTKVTTLPALWHNRPAEIVGDRIFLITEDPSGDERLWTSDGTAAGTVPLTPAGVPGGPLFASRFIPVGDRVFFVLRVEDPSEGFREELWVTQGTQATTRKLKRVQSDYRERTGALVARDGNVYLLGDTFDDLGRQRFVLWSSDGTTAGTVRTTISEWNEGGGLPSLDLVPTPHGLLFGGFSPETGIEPWITDGTLAGTRLLFDAMPGAASSNPGSFVPLPDGRVAFVATNAAHGRELWISDGTAAGMRPAHDVWPGAGSSDPDQLTVAGDHLYFVADDGLSGPELWAMPLSAQGPTCRADETSICLKGDRFRVEMRWMDFQGRTGEGKAVPLTEDTGYFWFFRPENVEAVLKVLDGRPINGHFWTYYGALSNVEYQTTVTDTATGATHRYFNPLGAFASAGDGKSFGPAGAGIDRIAPFVETGPRTLHAALPSATRRVAATGSCLPAANRLCLNDGRFALEASWTNFEGKTGDATASPLTGDTGTFWFFDDQNVELVVKVLDGTPINGHFWVYYGSLSNVGFVMTVTDTTTGLQKEYRNRIGRFASRGDGTAFPHE